MVQILTIIVSLVAAVICFFSPVWAWVIMALVDCSFIMILWGTKGRQARQIPELSQPANDLFQKYVHFYSTPFASRDYSASAATSQGAGVVLCIISVFEGFYTGIALGAINWVAMGFVAVRSPFCNEIQ